MPYTLELLLVSCCHGQLFLWTFLSSLVCWQLSTFSKNATGDVHINISTDYNLTHKYHQLESTILRKCYSVCSSINHRCCHIVQYIRRPEVDCCEYRSHRSSTISYGDAPTRVYQIICDHVVSDISMRRRRFQDIPFVQTCRQQLRLLVSTML